MEVLRLNGPLSPLTVEDPRLVQIPTSCPPVPRFDWNAGEGSAGFRASDCKGRWSTAGGLKFCSFRTEPLRPVLTGSYCPDWELKSWPGGALGESLRFLLKESAAISIAGKVGADMLSDLCCSLC